MDDNKFTKLLKVLVLCSGPYRVKRESLLEKTGLSERTFYRYIKDLRNAGFDIKNYRDEYFIDWDDTGINVFRSIFKITPEEAIILSKAISQIEASKEVKERLGKKLGLFDSIKVTQELIKQYASEKLETIYKAILEKRQVLLTGYHSGSSGSIADRLVEPFEFKNNFQYLMCFDVESKTNKLFKISRIGEVIISNLSWEYMRMHKSLPTDVFRICGELNKEVALKMNMLARNLLIEEYPLSEEFIGKQNDGLYIFKAKVAGWEGVGRFVSGLMDEVEIISPKDFKQFLKGKLKKSKNKFFTD